MTPASALPTRKTGLGMGLTGAHRTGKTTIAEHIVKHNELPFVVSSASAIAAEMGIDLTKPLSFSLRLAYQERILEVYEAMYEEQRDCFITDRTPLDLAAYLIADVPNDLADPMLIARTQLYIERCFAVTNRHFAMVMQIQPGIPYHAAPGKPLPNKAYQEAINTIILGLMYDDRLLVEIDVLDRSVTQLEDRIMAFADRVQATLEIFYRKTQQLPAC